VLVDRHLARRSLGASGATAVGIAFTLIAVDRLDPSAEGEPWSVAVHRAAWLAAAALVVTTALGPALLRSVLARDGRALALQAFGCSPARSVVPAAVLCALVAGLGVHALTSAGARSSPGVGPRPAPLEVPPWGAPEGVRWQAHTDTLLWKEGRSGWVYVRRDRRLSVRQATADELRHGVSPWAARGLRWALVGALGVGLSAAWGARRGGVRATWVGTVLGVGGLVVAVVAGANLAAEGDLWGAGRAQGTGAAFACGLAWAGARFASRQRPRG
jgi:hypothetical protein